MLPVFVGAFVLEVAQGVFAGFTVDVVDVCWWFWNFWHGRSVVRFRVVRVFERGVFYHVWVSSSAQGSFASFVTMVCPHCGELRWTFEAHDCPGVSS